MSKVLLSSHMKIKQFNRYPKLILYVIAKSVKKKAKPEPIRLENRLKKLNRNPIFIEIWFNVTYNMYVNS